MRRRITPALTLFCALLVTLLALPRIGSAVVAAAALVPAAASIALLAASDAAVRRARTLLAAAALGLALGAGSLYRVEAALEGGRLPVDPLNVAELTGVLRADSMLSREGDTLLRLQVREAATKSGIAAAARADALIIVRGDWRFAAGETISVRSGLREFGSTGRERSIAGVNRDDVRRNGFSSPVWLLRARIREWLHRAIAAIGYPASALLEALLIGAREDVPADLSEGFRATGSLHVLALSGLHAGIVFAFVAALLRPVRSRLAVYLAGSALLAGYLFVAGLMPSLVRAVVMLTVGGAARLADRDDEPLNLLAISGIVIVAADPFAAATLSFQLSFLALAGILSLGPVLGRPLEGRVPPLLATPLAASAGAQAATLPVVLLSFGVWYPSGIVAALLLVPLVTVFLWLGLAWLVVFPLAGRLVGAWAAGLFDVVYRAIAGVTGVLARLPGIAVAPEAAPTWAAVAGAAALALALLAPRGARSEPAWAR
jgi:competence protein ComEC